jgi:hypothetical protein
MPFESSNPCSDCIQMLRRFGSMSRKLRLIASRLMP